MSTPSRRLDWRADLEASRDLSDSEKSGFEVGLGWLEKWRVFSKSGDWAEAIRWYLHWVELVQKEGGEVRGLAERVRDAVDAAGARRGLRSG